MAISLIVSSCLTASALGNPGDVYVLAQGQTVGWLGFYDDNTAYMHIGRFESESFFYNKFTVRINRENKNGRDLICVDDSKFVIYVFEWSESPFIGLSCEKYNWYYALYKVDSNTARKQLKTLKKNYDWIMKCISNGWDL